MIKNFLAIATVTFLATACSSGGSDPAPTDNTGVPPTNGGVITPPTPPGGGNPPAADSKAGAYIGDFGAGNGVYVINNDNALSGLALAADGSAISLFGDVGAGNTFTGDLTSYVHDASLDGSAGAFGPGRPGAGAANPFNLNIVNGQTIESVSGASVLLSAATAGALSPATPSTLAGTWTGTHLFNFNGQLPLVTTVVFNGTDVTGGTDFFREGVSQFPNSISGTITEFGDVSLVSFNWGSGEDVFLYEGAVFFLPGGNSQLVFIGETQDDVGEEGRTTIASLLTR